MELIINGNIVCIGKIIIYIYEYVFLFIIFNVFLSVIFIFFLFFEILF